MVDFLKRKSLAYETIHRVEIRTKNLSITGRFILKKLKAIIDEDDDEANLVIKNGVLSKTSEDISLTRGSSTSKKGQVRIPKALKQKMTHQMHRQLEKATNEFLYLWQTVN